MKHFPLLLLLFLCLSQALTAQDITFLMGTQTYKSPAEGVSWVYHNGIGQYALANLKGERLTGFQFEAPAPFKHEVAIVKMEDKYYFLTKKGEIKGNGEPFILPAKNGYYYPGYTSKGDKISQDSLELGILTPYTRVCFRKNAPPAEYLPGSKYAVFKQAGKCGVIDSAGNVVIPAEYNEINLLKAPYVSILKNSKSGIASFDGTVLLAPEYDYITYDDSFYASFIAITNSKYKARAYSLHDKCFLTPEYDDIFPFYEGKAWAHRDHQYFLLDSLGTESYIGPDSIYELISKRFLRMDSDTGMAILTLNRQLIELPNDLVSKHYIGTTSNQLITYHLDTLDVILDEKGSKFTFTNVFHTQFDRGSNLSLLKKEYALLYEKKGTGLFDNNLKITIPTQYDIIRGVGPEMVAAQKNNKWYLLHPNGTQLNNTLFDTIVYRNRYCPVRQGKLWGLVNQKGSWETSYCIYDYVKPLQNGGLLLKQKEWVYYSYRDDPEPQPLPLILQWKLDAYFEQVDFDYFVGKGKIVTGLPYSREFSSYNGLTLVEKDEKYGYINTQSKKEIIPLIYDGGGNFYYYNLTIVKKGNKYGIINRKGEEVIPFKYDKIHYIYKNLVVVTVNQKMGIIDTLGLERLPPAYEYIGLTAHNRNPDSLALVKSNNLYGLISNKSGRLLCPAVYDSISVGYINAPECILVSRNKLLGVINTKGQELIPPVYQEISAFNDGEYFMVSKNGFYGIVDRQHQILVPPVYHQLNEHIIYKDKKAGILGSNFKETIAPQYEKITQVSKKTFLIEDQNKKFYAHIDKGILFQLPDIFDWIDPNQDIETGYFRVLKGNKWGFLNEKGEIVIPLNFMAVSYFHDGIAHVLPPNAPPSVEKHVYEKELPYPIDYLINAQGEIIGVEY